MGNLKAICLMFYNDSKIVSNFTFFNACQLYGDSCVSFLISTAGVVQVTPCSISGFLTLLQQHATLLFNVIESAST
jgi:hypothetical protein